MVLTRSAETIWRLLNGLVCVYKPAGVSTNRIVDALKYKITSELCELDCRPSTPHVTIEGDPRDKLTVKVRPSYYDSSLVIGPRYQPEDLRCTYALPLAKNTSGVLVFGLNDGSKLVYNLKKSHPVRTYRVSGKLGSATDNYFEDGAVVEKSTYKHVQIKHLEMLIANMQSSHQKTMFEQSGLDLQSQAAYELASKGLIRPVNDKLPILYSIKCIDFTLPNFTLEIQSINEYAGYFQGLVHEIGMKLKSTAHCTKIKCIRHSHFTLEHALLSKHWNLQFILDNMKICNEIYDTKCIEIKKSALLI